MLAAWVTGYGRVTLSCPRPRLPPPSLSPVARRVPGRAGRVDDWMWSCWPRETKSLSCPPLPPPCHPLRGGMTGRAGRVGDWILWSCWPRETKSLSCTPPFPLSPLTRCEAGEVVLAAWVIGCGRDWMWSCWPRETRSLSCPPFPPLSPIPPLSRCGADVGTSDRVCGRK